MNERIDGFIFYASYFDGISDLPEEDQGKLYVAIMNYVFAGKDPELKGALRMAFKFIRPTLDANIKKRLAGKKGGRPQEAKTQGNADGFNHTTNQEQTITETIPQTTPQPYPKANIKEKEKEKENKKDNKKDKENICPKQPPAADVLEVRPEDVLDLYNQICVSMPRAVKVTPDRRRKIKARLKDNDPQIFRYVFERAEASDFLTGRDGKWGMCNLDWIIDGPKHWQKILEGIYDNRRNKSTQGAAVDELRDQLNVNDQDRAEAAELG